MKKKQKKKVIKKTKERFLVYLITQVLVVGDSTIRIANMRSI